MSRDITALREALFDTLQKVKDGSLDVDKARAINEIGKTLVDSAKVEVEYLRATGGGESSFIDTAVGQSNLPSGITGITRHRLAG
jgi:mannitol/fructose-specific phosphotransferase system IIA component